MMNSEILFADTSGSFTSKLKVLVVHRVLIELRIFCSASRCPRLTADVFERWKMFGVKHHPLTPNVTVTFYLTYWHPSERIFFQNVGICLQLLFFSQSVILIELSLSPLSSKYLHWNVCGRTPNVKKAQRSARS